jgi:hypothetical protein
MFICIYIHTYIYFLFLQRTLRTVHFMRTQRIPMAMTSIYIVGLHITLICWQIRARLAKGTTWFLDLQIILICYLHVFNRLNIMSLPQVCWCFFCFFFFFLLFFFFFIFFFFFNFFFFLIFFFFFFFFFFFVFFFFFCLFFFFFVYGLFRREWFMIYLFILFSFLFIVYFVENDLWFIFLFYFLFYL